MSAHKKITKRLTLVWFQPPLRGCRHPPIAFGFQGKPDYVRGVFSGHVHGVPCHSWKLSVNNTNQGKALPTILFQRPPP